MLLTDVLSDLRPSLEAALRSASAQARHEGAEDPANDLTPTLKDWSDWTSSDKGMTFYFDDYQAGSHASGIRSIDILSSVLQAWVRPSAATLLGP